MFVASLGWNLVERVFEHAWLHRSVRRVERLAGLLTTLGPDGPVPIYLEQSRFDRKVPKSKQFSLVRLGARGGLDRDYSTMEFRCPETDRDGERGARQLGSPLLRQL